MPGLLVAEVTADAAVLGLLRLRLLCGAAAVPVAAVVAVCGLPVAAAVAAEEGRLRGLDRECDVQPLGERPSPTVVYLHLPH